jgi:diadenylate cyclase
LSALLDILLVAIFFFSLSFLVRGTQAVALVRGTVVLLISLIVLSSVLELQALRFILSQLLTVFLVAVPVIFQQEIRRVLERVGRGTIFNNRSAPATLRNSVIDEVCQAAERLAERRHGALIVLQRDSPLFDYVRTGIELDSKVSSQLLLTIFWPKTELHDGAAIIDNKGRIASAAAVLPLTASRNLPSRKMGTRHRAALGISEVSDALCVVVSEETGKIAVTNAGRMVSRLDADRLRTILNAFYGPDFTRQSNPFRRLREGAELLLDRVQSRLRQQT